MSRDAASPAPFPDLRALAAHLRPEALLFDVDGVLLDVRGSYLRAIELSVARALKRFARPAPPALTALVSRLKKIPGWNNDWDCAYGLVLIGLIAPGPEDYARIFTAVEAARHDLARLEATLTPLLEKPGQYDKALVWRDFQGHYLGRAALRELYGAEADFDADPLYETEPVLVPGEILTLLGQHHRIGVYTGRSPEEASLAFRRVGFTPDAVVADDGTHRKPDPGGILKLMRDLNFSRALYFGDSVDDAAAVTRMPSSADVRLVAVGGELPGMSLQIAADKLGAALKTLL